MASLPRSLKSSTTSVYVKIFRIWRTVDKKEEIWQFKNRLLSMDQQQTSSPPFPDNQSLSPMSFSHLSSSRVFQEPAVPVLSQKSGRRLVSRSCGNKAHGLKSVQSKPRELLWPISKDSKLWDWGRGLDSKSRSPGLRLLRHKFGNGIFGSASKTTQGLMGSFALKWALYPTSIWQA